MRSEPADAPSTPPARVPLWVKALGATLLMQAVAAFLTRVAPVIGPDLTDAAGVEPEAVDDRGMESLTRQGALPGREGIKHRT